MDSNVKPLYIWVDISIKWDFPRGEAQYLEDFTLSETSIYSSPAHSGSKGRKEANQYVKGEKKSIDRFSFSHL